MIEKSVPATRELRGLALYRERAAEIERISPSTYRVPSCTGEGSYLVYLDLQCCTCPDHRRAKAAGERCKHYHAVYVFAAKRRAAHRRQAS